jgi:hypothetical protein
LRRSRRNQGVSWGGVQRSDLEDIAEVTPHKQQPAETGQEALQQHAHEGRSDVSVDRELGRAGGGRRASEERARSSSARPDRGARSVYQR